MPQNQKQIRIVLIEDEKMLSDMYAAKFSKEGMSVMTAGDGDAGLALVKKEHPDIVLLDVIIPRIDGFAVLRELKNTADTKAIPVMLLTNLGQEDDVKKGRELGADDYFVKSDHTPAEVVEKVKNILAK